MVPYWMERGINMLLDNGKTEDEIVELIERVVNQIREQELRKQ